MNLVNDFTIGSDPEFAFARAHDSIKMPAADIGLKPGLCSGADQNLRLVEVRPKESRSALEHVAGILSTLRWLCISCPDAPAYRWRCGAFFSGDGLGGHVHFGRKEVDVKREVRILDGLAAVLRALPLFPVMEWDRRMKGDAYKLKKYGLPGDFRYQAHGYEYRSLPSWLGSPRQAFIVLAASKLALLSEQRIASWSKRRWQKSTAREALQKLAGEFEERDDDARILAAILRKPKHELIDWADGTWDFRERWGLHQFVSPLPERTILRIPDSIPPTSGEIEEVSRHLIDDKPLGYRFYPPTFRRSLPPGYRWILQTAVLAVHPGLGDLLHDVVSHESLPIRFRFGGRLFISKDLLEECPEGTLARMEDLLQREVKVAEDFKRTIALNQKSCQYNGVKTLRQILLDEGLFPLWRFDDVTEDSLHGWKIRGLLDEDYSDIPTDTPSERPLAYVEKV